MTDPNVQWITDKLMKEEQDLMLQQVQKFHDNLTGVPDVPNPAPTEPAAEPVPVDPDAERQAHADLLAFIANRDAGDADTVVTILTLEEFDAETFTPAPHDNPDLEA
jgi:hypothetical protein